MSWIGFLRRRIGLRHAPSAEPRFVVAGLGNPGRKYADTRHNLGFWVCDRLAAGAPQGWRPASYRADEWTGEIDGTALVLVKPQTFVNDSGDPVRAALRRHGLDADRLIVVHDDIDLAFARLRLRRGGTSGGHKGLKSIIGVLQTDAFMRVKIGVGRPPPGEDPAAFVLQPFSAGERNAIESTLQRALAAVRALLVRDLDEVMQEFN